MTNVSQGAPQEVREVETMQRSKLAKVTIFSLSITSSTMNTIMTVNS